MVINNWVTISSKAIARDNILFPQQEITTPEQLYSALNCAYPKFYKMDILCKWAFVAAEYLFGKDKPPYKDLDKNKIAVLLTTHSGSIEVDKRFAENMSMPSPALFVYTLPNIMLGELCIRHGFKGEQLCMISEQFDPAELYFNVHRFLMQTEMDACLCGWVNATGTEHDICLFWITKKGTGVAFTPEAIYQLYKGGHS